MKTFKVSVVIPTYNGAHRILNTIKALESQSYQDFETVVVIDGSTDNTHEALRQYPSTLKKLKVITQSNGGRAKVRNRGVKEAIGDLLIFYDDDMRPAPDSVLRHVQFYENNRNAICGGNPLEDDTALKTDIQFYKKSLSIKWTNKYHKGLNQLTQGNLFLTAANFSITKSLFTELGGFNEKLTDAEDFELAVRARENGFELIFDKSNMAWHDDFITCRSYILRQRQYAKAYDILKEYIHTQYLRKPLAINSLAWYKKMVYSILSNRFFVNQIDKEHLLWLPKEWRYKIYDWVITGLGRIYIDKKI